MLHETLEVEVGKLVRRGNLKELGELGIGVNLTAVGLILKTIRRDIRVNLLAHIGAGHLRANGLAEESSKLLADERGLHETGGLAGASGLALLGRSLLGGLHLAGDGLIKGLEIILDGGEETGKLLELGVELGDTSSDVRHVGGGSNRSDRRRGSNDGSRGDRRRGSNLSLGLTAAGLRLDGSGGGNRGGGGSLRGSNHSGYILLTNHAFKLFSE